MKVKDLIDNPEFTFNLKFRLAEYDFDSNKLKILCTDDDDCSEFYDWDITAVNHEADGTVTIECTQFSIY